MAAREETTRICVIGAGPRGLSVVERLCAHSRLPQWQGRRFAVHLVDPRGPGGRVWRADQNAELLMNTVASQITLFSDDSVDCAGPVVPGPSLHQWAALVDDLTSPGELPEEDRREAQRLGPDAYPTRRLYGHYLAWVLAWLRRHAPRNITITVHRATAVALHDDRRAGQDTQLVVLDDGTELDGLDAVVLAQGHVPMEPTAREREWAAHARRHGLLYHPPGNPADLDLRPIGPGRRVGLLGMGLSCFDVVALLTTGRGGRFERYGGHLEYRPSGREPELYLGSRRGLPYHARGENEKGVSGRHTPLFLTPAVIDALRRRRRAAGPLSFRTDVWPLVSREVRAVYYHALLAERGEPAAADAFRAEFVARGGGEGTEELLDRHGVPRALRWSWERIERPYGDRVFTGPDDFRHWLLAHLRADVTEALKGNVTSPLKAALDVLRDLRNEIRLVVDHGGIGGRSYRDELTGWYTPLNAYLSIGPPARRIEELTALIEAGVVHVCGPDVRAEPGPGGDGFRLRSARVPGSTVRVTALIEARLPEVDVRTTEDPLLRGLLDTGQCVPYRIPEPGGEAYESGGIAVSRRPYHLLDATLRPHPRRFAFGVPTEGVHWVTAAGIRPGVDSVIVGDSDAIARTCLPAADARLAALRTRSLPAPYLHRHVPLAWLPSTWAAPAVLAREAHR
ncbi:FAD/NAD(P)-binding protein [Streptomyces sp. ISL-36]|uniref:FAD/NAD(P)-binding protein n=1 Tax=Streptomyces sp. ISL-36 TaxID=2819182 RepID=UPI001BEB86A8|nr:FAD/NAD(P)-binding protein [Streptomyces sp. ISL-36]